MKLIVVLALVSFLSRNSYAEERSMLKTISIGDIVFSIATGSPGLVRGFYSNGDAYVKFNGGGADIRLPLDMLGVTTICTTDHFCPGEGVITKDGTEGVVYAVFPMTSSPTTVVTPLNSNEYAVFTSKSLVKTGKTYPIIVVFTTRFSLTPDILWTRKVHRS